MLKCVFKNCKEEASLQMVESPYAYLCVDHSMGLGPLTNISERLLKLARRQNEHP